MDLRIKIGNVEFENPLWVASGTFGSGEEFRGLTDLDKIGAIVTKTVTRAPREGNKPQRIVETPSGMLNSIGIENKGIEHFVRRVYPETARNKTKIIVSISGDTIKDFEECAQRVSEETEAAGIEVNLSCPNILHKGTRYKLIAQDPALTEKITAKIKKVSKGLVFAKLTPNVTDITEIAKAAEAGGADAVSLVNTYMGMAVDPYTRKPVLGNITGGLSGPAIKPMALKSVWDVYNSITVPIVGIGGIMTGEDVAEFMLCGAAAIQTGTANLADPSSHGRILSEFREYMKKSGSSSPEEITGRLEAGQRDPG